MKEEKELEKGMAVAEEAGLSAEELEGVSEEVAEKAFEISDEHRKDIIADFNKANEGRAVIAEEKPTQEEIDAVVLDFKNANDEYASKSFMLADKDNALRVAKFLKKWNETKGVWKGDQCEGMVKFDAVMADFIGRCEKDAEALVVDFGCLSYLWAVMSNTMGVGLKSAIEYLAHKEEYTKIFTVVQKEVDDYKNMYAELEKKQTIAQLYTQGYKVSFIEPDDGRMSKEEFRQNILDHWDETADLRERVLADPMSFGFTLEEAQEFCVSNKCECGCEDCDGKCECGAKSEE